MNYRIILVEDGSRIRKGMKLLIEGMIGGFEVVGEFDDGRQALERGTRLRPDVLITDIRMKDMGGLELIEKIRLDLPQTSIVIISGYNDFLYVKKALRYKVFDYLLKPIDRVEFSQCLMKLRTELDSRSGAMQPLSALHEQELEEGEKSLAVRRIKQLEQPLTLKAIADQIHLSPKYVSELFKKQTRENFTDYLIRSRMFRAKTLLRSTQLKVYEIAAMVGYANTKHFMTLFREETGLTPTTYRNEERE